MFWNWEKPDWPDFTWKQARFAAAEERFRTGGGIFLGSIRHIVGQERRLLLVEAMSTESATTSAIEGEILDRASVQSSIQRQLGLKADPKRIRPSEEGVAEMMVDLYRTSAKTALRRDALWLASQADEGPRPARSWPLSCRRRSHADHLRRHWQATHPLRGASGAACSGGDEALRRLVQSNVAQPHRTQRQTAVACPRPRRNRPPLLRVHPPL